MSDQIKAPEFPSELESNTRRAARAIKSTVREAIDTMQEVAAIINRYRAGNDAIVKRLTDSQTPESGEWRRSVEIAVTRDKEADENYEAAIKPLREARDAAKKATADQVKEYFDKAVSAEPFTDDETPVTTEEYAEAVMDWTASVKQLRDAERNAKNQLQVEFSVPVQSIGSTRESGATGGQWRPRFQAATVNGKDLGVNPILTDVVAEIPGMSRDLFQGQMLKHLAGSTRSAWDSGMSEGDTLTFSFTHNDNGYSVTLVKAPPVGANRGETDTDEESDDSAETEVTA
jgi:hypothetical protein